MKNSYILLRSNKESGPFTLEQLRQQGLKADDLVWVEGQSVAWLNPSQIPSLRDFVNAAGESSTATIIEEENKYMPSAGIETMVSLPEIPATPQEETPPVKHVAVDDGEIPRTKYEKPLDEIRDMYVKTLEERKRKRARKQMMAKYARYAGVVLALVLAGTFLGITIQKKRGNREKPVPVQAGVQQAAPVMSNEIVVNNDSTPPMELPPAEDPQEIKMTDIRPQEPQAVSTREQQPRETPRDEKNVATITQEEKEKPAASAKVNIDEITDLVAVTPNDYKIGAFGGIRGLQLTLTNDSKYALEKVVVELHYLKLGDELVRSETILFHNVPANGSRTMDIPASKRGVKVTCKVRSIEPSPKANVAGF